MEIHQLRASITENDLNTLLKRFLPTDLPVEDLRLRVLPEGLQILGMYPLFVNVHFETLWELSGLKGRVAARMTQFKALGIPAGIFKSAILKVMEEIVRQEPSLELVEDTLILDVDRLLVAQGLAVRTNVRAVATQPGMLQLECGT